MTMTYYFCCPVCRNSLETDGKRCFCKKGHSFDLAAEGYAYLLQPNKKHSRMPGDDRQMVAARRKLLDSGIYGLFAEKLAELAVSSARGREQIRLLDAGCGEGYYTAHTAEALRGAGIACEAGGFDISKAAVRAAAKRCRDVSFAVASAFGVPVADASVDCLTDVFAPIVPEEFARVVRPGGSMILATPSKRHLYGLKEILYDEPYENEEQEIVYPGFSFIERVPVRGIAELDAPEMIWALFQMTPYYWKTPEKGCEKLRAQCFLRTEIGFDFLVYRREPHSR